MSDISGSEPIEDLGDEQADGGEQTAEVEEAYEPWAEFDQYADQRVPVVVNGEEQLVPLADLRDGYMRQQDYTQKTQSVAEDRRALAQAEALYKALGQDPNKTIAMLQAAYGVEEGNQIPENDDDLYLTDEERKIAELEAYVHGQQQREYATQVQAELDGLVEQFGVDPDLLVDFAIERNYDNLTDAYARFHLEQSAAEKAAAAKRAASEQARLEAKRGASDVAGGTSRNPAAAVAPTSGHKTVASALRAARDQLGV